MSFSKYSGKGLNGLANLGNTCFMNSVLHCLAHTYELFDTEKEKKTDKIFDIKIFDEYFKLIHFMWDEDSTISPNGFLKYVQFVSTRKGIAMFTGFDQNDFSEFLLFMISCFHDSIKKKEQFKMIENNVHSEVLNKFFRKMYNKDYSKISDIFNGIQLNIVYDKESGEKLSTTVDNFTMLSLSIPDKKNISLMDCFDEHFKNVELVGEDKYVLPDNHKNKGEKVNAVLKSSLWSLPKILIVSLLRVKIIQGRMFKNKDNISYDETIDLSKYSDNKLGNYSLYAIGEHHGSMHGGHYTCLVKNANNKWYRYNDMKVNEVKSINNNNAYTFFYRKNL